MRAFQSDALEDGSPVEFFVAVSDHFIVPIRPIEDMTRAALRTEVFKVMPLSVLRVLVPFATLDATL